MPADPRPIPVPDIDTAPYWKAARKGSRNWREQVLPEQELALCAFSEFDLENAPPARLVKHIERLLVFNATAWDNAVRASRTYVFTEPLLLRVFKRFIQPITGGDALTLLCGFESQIMAGEHAQWKLTQSALALEPVAHYLQSYAPEEAWERMKADPACAAWVRELGECQQKYGHSNANLDYLHPSVADDPAQAVRSITSKQTRLSTLNTSGSRVTRDTGRRPLWPWPMIRV